MRRWGLAACGLVAILAAGCGSQASTTGGEPAPAGAAPEPRQPFDIIRTEQAGLIDHTQQRIRNRCLAGVGYPQDSAHQLPEPQNPFAFLTVSARDFGPTSEEEARRTGFGRDSAPEPARVVSTDPNFDAASERCALAAWHRIGPDALRIRQSYTDLVNVLAPYRRDVDAELPADLAVATFDCMAGRGYRAPDRDAFLKTPSHRLFGVQYGGADGGAEEAWEPVRKPGTVEVGPAIPARRYTPTPQESELAVAWFHCGLQTGRVEQKLAAVQRVQQRYVAKYQTWIDEVNPRIEELARHAATIASGS